MDWAWIGKLEENKTHKSESTTASWEFRLQAQANPDLQLNPILKFSKLI
jgi:hypothetical protein